MEVQDCYKTMMCTIFEDNNRAIELSKTSKMSLRTKHATIKHFHFRSFVVKGVIRILKVDTAEQEADFITKPLPDALFNYLRKKVLG